MLDFKSLLVVDKWLQVYLIFKAFDFITGFLKAYKVEGFKSKKLREGVILTIAEIIAIYFAKVLDLLLGLNIIVLSTQTLFVFKEGISIIENLGVLGVNLPKVLTDKIQDLNPEKNNKEDM